MKKYKVTREIQKFNENAKNVNELYQTTEKGTLKVFQKLEDAKNYLADLRRRALRKAWFESVRNCGVRHFRAHTADKVYIYKVV